MPLLTSTTSERRAKLEANPTLYARAQLVGEAEALAVMSGVSLVNMEAGWNAGEECARREFFRLAWLATITALMTDFILCLVLLKLIQWN